MDPRTRVLLEAPIASTLLRLATPNVLIMLAQAATGLVVWPLLGTVARLAIVALAGWLALRWTGELSHVFLAQSVGLIAAGFINLAAIAGGAWFGSLTWPWSTAAALLRRSSI